MILPKKWNLIWLNGKPRQNTSEEYFDRISKVCAHTSLSKKKNTNVLTRLAFGPCLPLLLRIPSSSGSLRLKSLPRGKKKKKGGGEKHNCTELAKNKKCSWHVTDLVLVAPEEIPIPHVGNHWLYPNGSAIQLCQIHNCSSFNGRSLSPYFL